MLEQIGADVVIGDIPPLAMAAADRAGVPGVAGGNFTWDWRILGVPGDRPVVLASFGGYGVNLPLDRIRQTGRLTLLEPVRDPPAGLSLVGESPAVT